MYYRLTYISSLDKAQVGDSMLNGNKPLNIGHSVTCDLKLFGFEQYEPEIIASILPNSDGDGWYVVKRTDNYNCLVNGESINIAEMLKNGDVLTFADSDTTKTKLKFETFNDGEYDTSSGIVYKKHKSNKNYLVGVLAVAIIALGLAAYSFFTHNKNLRDENLRVYHQSIYHITTDSVYLLCDTIVEGLHKMIVLDSIELDKVAEGTAFLTSDNLFITARHCIEPWINDEQWDGVSSKAKMSPEVRLATKAETENRIAGYEKYILRAHFVISKGFERYDYYSTDSDVYMNKSRDMVMRLGNSDEVLYWRTIFPIAQRRDMELGDFAYVKASPINIGTTKSQISIAKWDDIIDFVNQGNHDIAVMGYPLNDNNTEVVTDVFGNLMAFEYIDSLKTPVGCLQLSAGINPGNSGGPIFAKIGNEIKVIGIVSKADGKATQDVFWAVPITEVVNMHNNKDSITVDSVTYRR